MVLVARVLKDNNVFPDQRKALRSDADLSHRWCLSISFRNSTPPQNRPLVVYYYLKYQVDDFVGWVTLKN